jgi:tetratricopeptide (TPR) repeat protein
MRLKVFICLALALVTFGLYWPAGHFASLAFDDQYFLENPYAAVGLSLPGIFWAVTTVVAENWHPITTFSFLLTHEFWGLNPGAEHLLNAGVHAANAVLLFLVLLEMTGAAWRSAIVAAIFAWHPLRVESVAWIAERKDVLFMFFMLLSLLFYVRYTRAGPGKPLPPPDKRTIFDTPPRTLFFNLALLFFILSLLSKAMSVTLPFLLLLLDVWPLRRFNALAAPKPGEGGSTLQRLLREKLPFFIASAFFCVITFRIQKAHDALASLHEIGMGARLENVIYSYAGYLGKFLWPSNLSLLYPFPNSFDIVQVALSGLLLLAISALCILQFSRRPYLAVGWLWFLGTMVPVIGLVQLGEQGIADRYTYLPLIGPVISIVWLVSDWVQTNPFRKWAAVSVTAVILAVCVVLTTRQLQYWHDTITLFTRTIAVTQDNYLAEYPLAKAFELEGLDRQAAVHYRIAIAKGPIVENFWPNFYFAELLAKGGHYQEARERMETAVQIKPEHTDALNNLAWLLSTCPDKKVRDGERAIQLAEHACELTHDGSAKYLTTLSAAYAEAGRFDDAIATVEKAGALAQQTGQSGLFSGDAKLLELFTDHQTYTDQLK